MKFLSFVMAAALIVITYFTAEEGSNSALAVLIFCSTAYIVVEVERAREAILKRLDERAATRGEAMVLDRPAE